MHDPEWGSNIPLSTGLRTQSLFKIKIQPPLLTSRAQEGTSPPKSWATMSLAISLEAEAEAQESGFVEAHQLASIGEKDRDCISYRN